MALASAAATTLLTTANLAATQVELAWDPSVSPSVTGYRLYYGTTSQSYTNVLDVGALTFSTVSNLIPATTYYFAVTAYDVVGLESDFSTEIGYTVPPPKVALQLAVDPRRGASLAGSGPAGYSYDVQISTDLQNWTSLTNLTLDAAGEFQFTDSAVLAEAMRFYRLQQVSP